MTEPNGAHSYATWGWGPVTVAEDGNSFSLREIVAGGLDVVEHDSTGYGIVVVWYPPMNPETGLPLRRVDHDSDRVEIYLQKTEEPDDYA